jgi:hypothetical protein
MRTFFQQRRKGKYTDLISIDLFKVFLLWDFPFKVKKYDLADKNESSNNGRPVPKINPHFEKNAR